MVLLVEHQDNEPRFGGESHLALSGRVSFAELIFRLLAERSPAPRELKIFELILNLSIDHGPETPSARATIAAAEIGRPIGWAVGAGVGQINSQHGGAQTLCLPLLYRMSRERVSAVEIVSEYLRLGNRLPGFGHRLYRGSDPRADLILAVLAREGLGGEFIAAARELAAELARQTGKKLPLNVDGAIAVAFGAFGWPTALGEAVFIIARTPGLCGQYLNHSNRSIHEPPTHL